MSNQITLSYELSQFKLKVNGMALGQYQEMEEAIQSFKQMIKNNGITTTSLSWEVAQKMIEDLELASVEVQEQYRTITLNEVKYFYNTGKVFYMAKGQMMTLVGGFEIFYRLLNLVKQAYIKEVACVAEICSKATEKNVSYSLMEDELILSSAAFSYGTVGYDFVKGKMNKGTTTELCSFEAFKKYVMESI